MSILDAPLVARTRRNHGLEHATIHLLARQFPNRPLAGHSNPTGFILLGDVPTEAVRGAVAQALARMQNGERHLAIHPGCGTNYVATGAIAGLFAWLVMLGARDSRERLSRLPLVILAATLGFILGQPLGPILQQKITTDGDPADLTIVDVALLRAGMHRVITHS
jgi:hypothetical protein